MNPAAMEVSPSSPISTGETAPPTIDMTRYDEAVFVPSPRMSARARENIVGNMTLSKRYVRQRAAMPAVPEQRITRTMHIAAPDEHAAIITAGRTVRIATEPRRRPIMKSPMPPKESISAAVLAVISGPASMT